MERTGHDVAVQLALTDRPAAVEARVAEGVERPVDIEESDQMTGHDYDLWCAGRNLVHLYHGHESSHTRGRGAPAILTWWAGYAISRDFPRLSSWPERFRYSG